MMEKVVHKTSWYAIVLPETYHTRLSSITRDDNKLSRFRQSP